MKENIPGFEKLLCQLLPASKSLNFLTSIAYDFPCSGMVQDRMELTGPGWVYLGAIFRSLL